MGSGRLCVVSERLSGWVGRKDGWVGQVGKYVRWLGSSGGSGK